MPLSLKKQRFIAEYLVDCVGKDAAIRAGYSEASATQAACNLLAEPEVAAAIAEAQARFVSRCEVTAEAVIAELATIGFMTVGPDDEGRAPLLSVKRAALVDIGKHLGLFVEKHEFSGADGAPLIPVLNVYTTTADNRPPSAPKATDSPRHQSD